MSMGRMGVAVEEIVRELAEARLRTLERDRTSALISWTDSMIGELEVLNLRDVPRVSSDWRGRLALLFASLPFEYVPRLNSYPWSPTEVLDVLFDVQAYLFDLKNGRSAASAAEADEARAS